VQVAPEIAAEMALGILLASGAARADRPGGTWVEPIELARVSTWQLVGVLLRRVRASIAGKGQRMVRRIRP
jgi:hypothetical protein